MKVAVGSNNPVKIEAVRVAFENVWPEQEWKVIGVATSSGISAQPMSDQESITGARNRAKGALVEEGAVYGVGLEEGVQQMAAHWFNGGWIVVIDPHGCEGVASTVRLAVPPHMMKMIHQGMELSEADDLVFQQQNSRHTQGYFGLMTRGLITRRAAYIDGVIAALTRFVHADLFVKVCMERGEP